MRYGGLAELHDGEGLNCLHIAAQFGLTGIMAYFISCRNPIVSISLTSIVYMYMYTQKKLF